MTREEKISAIKETAEEIGGDVRDSYSGRGMFGATCYGIVCDDSNECIAIAGSKGLRCASRDNMGLHSIVYWPSVKGIF